MKVQFGFALLIAALVCFSCGRSVAQKSGKSHKDGPYSEDISVLRIKYPDQDTVKAIKQDNTPMPLPKMDITAKLAQKMDSIAAYNNRYNTTQGFRILLYSGTSSAEAKSIKVRAYDVIADEPLYDTYTPPSFRVKVGDFTERVDAYYILSFLKKDFPNAMVVPDQINIIKK